MRRLVYLVRNDVASVIQARARIAVLVETGRGRQNSQTKSRSACGIDLFDSLILEIIGRITPRYLVLMKGDRQGPAVF